MRLEWQQGVHHEDTGYISNEIYIGILRTQLFIYQDHELGWCMHWLAPALFKGAIFTKIELGLSVDNLQAAKEFAPVLLASLVEVFSEDLRRAV